MECALSTGDWTRVMTDPSADQGMTPIRSALSRIWVRPEMSGLALTLASASFIMVAYNVMFWRYAVEIFSGRPLQMVVFGAAVWTLTVLTMLLFGFRWLQKPVIVLLFIVSAVASYYQDNLGAIIDREMIQNAMSTTTNESSALITTRFILTVAVWGVLPALLVIWVRVQPRPFWRDLLTWPLRVALCFALFAGLLFSDYKAYSAVLRDRREMMSNYQPGATIAAVTRYGKMMARARNVVVEPLGRDAVKGPLLAAATKPVLTVVFVGETTRAQNWGLNGAAQDTTPELRKRGVINFTDVSSCGTSTAVSLPCMMSVYTRDEYSYQKQVSTENLLDVLNTAGVSIQWLDNNAGDYDLAKRTGGMKMMTAEVDPAACLSGECTDAVFIKPIANVLATITEDTVLVIHMIGNHGPAYYMRYPPEFEKFKPACRTPEFAKCTPAEIVNAYDNAILFADKVLSQTIDMMQAQDRVIPSMLYVSDHGESLGEDGLYLHAAPRFLAPDVQTKVPMVLWMSEAYKTTLGLTDACLAAQADKPTSQDAIFSTVLGLMDISTSVRDPALDLTQGCRVQG